MNETLTEWIKKAEGDFSVAKREMETPEANYDAICFHAQQAAEKYLKAFLFKNQVDFPKIHSLIELLELCLPLDASLETRRELFDRLEDYAVLYRYPGASANREDAEEAFRAAETIRTVLRVKLGLHD